MQCELRMRSGSLSVVLSMMTKAVTNITSEGKAKPVLHIPGVFCWSKIGAESGQELEKILLRKELERQLGKGLFGWGIGNSLRPEFRAGRAEDRTIPVVFSTMISRPKLIDREPTAVWLWQSYTDQGGRPVPLPSHMLVTSRAKPSVNGAYRPHYVLFCRNDHPLTATADDTVVDSAVLCNAATGRPLGHSQVTALVRISDAGAPTEHKLYPVTALADLVEPYCASLSEPVRLPQRLRQLLEVTEATALDTWADTVETVRDWARVSGGQPKTIAVLK